MKSFIRIVIIYLLAFLFVATGVNIFLFTRQNKTDNTRNIVMNRIVREGYSDDNFVGTKNVNHEEYIKQFGKNSFPDSIMFISVDRIEESKLNFSDGKKERYVLPCKNSRDVLQGFVVFEYTNNSFKKMMIITNAILLLAFIFILIFALFVLKKILKPFVDLQEYPKRLSLGEKTEKLPESKNKYFGKYIWAMNMLQDVLENERQKVTKLIKDKQTLTSTFAHGIKTPVSNIKLYANAIQTGLYSEIVNPKDVEIATKIEKNADDIQKLVSDILDTTTKSLFEYEPQITTFYMNEIAEFIITEYDNKFKMKKIPYNIEQTDNPLLKSDKTGICKILFQLLDNAIKYGDGTGIKIKLERQDKSFYFSVTNNGNSLGENEIPYMFNSYWRGSNATGVEGQGIGLYEAKQIAKKLGGNLFVNYNDSSVEVLLMI